MAAGELSLEAVRRLIVRSGVERISEKATEELRSTLERIADTIARKAIGLASHAGRKTVKAQDVRLAVSSILRD